MTAGGKRWVIPAILVAGCVGTGAWAVPQFLDARDLADGTHSSTQAVQPHDVSTVEATGSVDASALKASLDSISNDFSGGNITGSVVDAASGEVLYSNGADKPRVPASNFKLLTDYTLMRVTDPNERLTTSVARDGETLTLVAGGDTLLGTGENHPDEVVGHAGVQTLAEETVEALKDQEGKTFTLNVDNSRFSGPHLNNSWAQEDIDAGFVTNIYPLAFYSHYSPDDQGLSTTNRPENASAEVQQHLLDDLNELGKKYDLTFETGKETTASEQAESIASVESATIAEQAAYMMQESDNMLAEVLGRNLSVLDGGDGSLESAKNIIAETLQEDGINTESLTIDDLSGLSLDNRVTNTTLTEIIARMVAGENGTDAALAGLPVAGGTGTLAERFDDSDEQSAQGYARAKTGTLNSVISLSGYTTTADGQVLIYSFITNNVTDPTSAKNTLDRSVAAVTGRS